jgi:antirestriction protein ArdC
LKNDRADIHQAITDKIIAAIEAGVGDFIMPWHRQKGGSKPKNVLTGNFYRGINILALWVEAQANGYSSNLWGTYRQWSEKGAQVRKGAKASCSVFYKQISIPSEEGAEELRPVIRATPVFNADQVDNWSDGEASAVPEADPFAPLPHIEMFIAATAAKVVHSGGLACYNPSTDAVHMPDRKRFIGTPTSTPTQAYYSTLSHELVHWTGAKHRCDRELTQRFGTNAYAMEELIAELGAAYLCSDLCLTAEPRPDHAQYIASWLQVLRHDKRAIFTAASSANRAVEFLQALVPA